jgi:hypothetical protein
VANLVRVAIIPVSTLAGYWLYGFNGFLWANVLANLVVLVYFYAEQRREGLLDARSEWVRAGWASGMFVACAALSALLLRFVPLGSLQHIIRGH